MLHHLATLVSNDTAEAREGRWLWRILKSIGLRRGHRVGLLIVKLALDYVLITLILGILGSYIADVGLLAARLVRLSAWDIIVRGDIKVALLRTEIPSDEPTLGRPQRVLATTDYELLVVPRLGEIVVDHCLLVHECVIEGRYLIEAIVVRAGVLPRQSASKIQWRCISPAFLTGIDPSSFTIKLNKLVNELFGLSSPSLWLRSLIVVIALRWEHR